MGHYTGIATKLRVKKTAEKRLIDFLDFLYQIGGEHSEQPLPQNQEQAALNEMIAMVNRMLVCGSAYFECWEWRVKEDKGDFWLYESRASATDWDLDAFISLLNGIRENLVVEENDILLRSIYEESSVERIISFLNGEFKEERGFEFKSDRGYISDSRHPLRHERHASELPWNSAVRHDDDCNLPWKLDELRALVAEEKKKRDANWHPWG